MKLPQLQNYSIAETLENNLNSKVYRAMHGCQKILIKLLSPPNPTPSEIARLKKEFELIKSTSIKNVIKLYDIIENKNEIAVVMEDVAGVPLNRSDHFCFFPLADFLDLAIQITFTLGSLHEHNIIHRDIRPHNVFIQNGSITLSNFGVFTDFAHERDEIHHPSVLENHLPYMSPEQTGRMNRTVDYRTDIYSLGIMFYEMLTGFVPFQYDDPLELIHAHIARLPVPPHEHNPDIPETLSLLIVKLLQKTAEERYQNCFGVLSDLQRCLVQLNQHGAVQPFQLGRNDISIKFTIPHMLIGRENEIDILQQKSALAQNGKKQIVFISGNPGIGKSALVNEIQKSVITKNCYFISGKYDRFRTEVPYSSIIAAFQGLIRRLLSETEAQIDIWKQKLLSALGANGNVIINVIPEIKYIIGEQPEIQVIGPEEALNRFNLVFDNFAKVFSTKAAPLVLFLDDLQWADAASFELLKILLTDPDLNYFFFIGAYRDNEVDQSHPLMKTANTLSRTDIQIDTVPLAPLGINAVNQFLANLFKCEPSTSGEFAELIHHTTNGNPFYIKQFLKTLYEEKVLHITRSARPSEKDIQIWEWKWNLKDIARVGMKTNPIHYLSEEITGFSRATQEILKICACIGNRFDLETLAYFLNKPVSEILSELTEAIDKGFIYFEDPMYAFCHDRIHEAARSLLSENEKIHLHFGIGNLILKKYMGRHELEHKLLFIVNHLNYAADLIENPMERIRLAELNLMAGKKAKNSAAYQSAFGYFKIGMDLLNQNPSSGIINNGHGTSWEKYYHLTLSLHVEAAEAAYLITDYTAMTSISNAVLKNARTLLDKIKVHDIKMKTYMAQNQMLEAIKTGKEVLKLMDIQFPDNPGLVHILFSLARTRLAHSGRRIENLVNRPEMTDPYNLAKIHFLASIATAAYWAQPNLLPLLVCKMINLSIKHGNARISAYGYLAYGLILCSIGDIDTGYQFGKMAMAIVERRNIRELRARTRFMMNAFIEHWKSHAISTIEPLKIAYHDGLDTGDFEFSAYAAMVYCNHLYFSGYHLGELEKEIHHFKNVVFRLQQISQFNYLQIFHQTVLNLINKNEPAYHLAGSSYQEEEMLSVHLKASDQLNLFAVYFNKAILSYLFQYAQQAYEFIQEAEKYINAVAASMVVSLFYYYDALIRAGICQDLPKKEHKNHMKKIRKNLKILKRNAFYAPMNRLSHYCLVQAEIARIHQRYDEAMEFYLQAIKCAKDNGYIQDEALAHELAARFFFSIGDATQAHQYVNKSEACYRQWGALSKADHLQKQFHGRINA